jgi:hypothetical protein
VIITVQKRPQEDNPEEEAGEEEELVEHRGAGLVNNSEVQEDKDDQLVEVGQDGLATLFLTVPYPLKHQILGIQQAQILLPFEILVLTCLIIWQNNLLNWNSLVNSSIETSYSILWMQLMLMQSRKRPQSA